jgi:hypothetical protein
MQTKQDIPNDAIVTSNMLPKSTIVITAPTRASRRFEDNVTVIRTFNPDQERMAAALRLILRFPPKKGGDVNDSVTLSPLWTQICGN